MIQIDLRAKDFALLTKTRQTVFSMTFFNWTPAEGEAVLSPYIWIYAVGTAIFTCLTLGSWYCYGQHRKGPWTRNDSTFDSVQEQGNKSSGDIDKKECGGYVEQVENRGNGTDKV